MAEWLGVQPVATVDELEGQVTAFTELSEAIKVVDGVLGRASTELADFAARTAPRLSSGRREVRAVALG
jgi:hypothetical protein